MRMIDKMIDHINEELEGAKEYAEKYIECKSRGDTTRASKYHDMANDELRHASNIHDFAIMDVDSIKNVYPLSVEDEEKWTHAHKHFAECTAIIRQMLM
jgi:ferritin